MQEMSRPAHDLDGEVTIRSATNEEEENIKALKSEAEAIAKKVGAEVYGHATVTTVDFLAQGGYNNVWVATCNLLEGREPERFIVRICRNIPSLHPYQVRNEVASLRWLASNLPSIPVPKLYGWNDGVSDSGPAFTAVQYVDGQRLSFVWPQLTEEQKSDVCRQIANVIADLGETRFQLLGSLTPGTASAPTFGPTVEAAKLFNGRAKIHSQACYDIGPYTNSKAYILACYDREIYFYTHADPSDIEDFFENTTVSDFIDVLKRRRQELEDADPETFQQIDAEPRVLVHEDFHAGNMLVCDGKLVAVLDWEFSGVYPLSELLRPAQILQMSIPLADRNEQTEMEEDRWDERYRLTVSEVVRGRGWAERDIETLLGKGHEVLRVARKIMFPLPD